MNTFTPGRIWPDTNGVPINAHGGGILFHNGVYYWFGEHKSEGEEGKVAHPGVHVYSSTDLYHWTDEGMALSVSDDPQSDLARGCVLERPKVVFNQTTRQFVMWFHLELKGQGYEAARSGVAVSDQVTGPYTFLESFRPNGAMARDQTLFSDDDGHVYHFYASEENRTLHISRMNEEYLKPSGQFIRVFEDRYMEAPAVCKWNETYYFIASGCTGWAPNAARSATAESIFGPWRETGNPCRGVNSHNGYGPEKTFGAQSTFLLPVQDKSDAFIAMFDIWTPGDAPNSRHVWLPLQFTRDGVLIEWMDEWDLSFF